MTPYDRRAGERGQVLVLGALMMMVLLGFLALVIDVGNGYAQRRFTQNGADAAAFAAARLIATRLQSTTPDALVAGQVSQLSSANGGATVPLNAALTAADGAWYVTPGGRRIAAVGSGVTIPTAPSDGFPTLLGLPVGGVEVVARRDFDTYFAGVLGIERMTVRATGSAGFGGPSTVELDWSESGVPVAPMAFDVEAVTTKLGACGGYGATIQIDQYINTPTECIYDTVAHFSFSTLNIGSNCSNSTVKGTLDSLIDNPASFGTSIIQVGVTPIRICHGIRSSSIGRLVSVGRPMLVPLVSHARAEACVPQCDAPVVGFAYLMITARYGNGSGSYLEGHWVDPRTMPPIRGGSVATDTTRIYGPLSLALLR